MRIIITVMLMLSLIGAFVLDARAENYITAIKLLKTEKLSVSKIGAVKALKSEEIQTNSLSSAMIGAAKKASKDKGKSAVIGAATGATVNFQTKKEGILNKIGKPRYMGTTIGIPKIPEQPAKRIGGINKGPGIPKMPELPSKRIGDIR